jgi:hypothetical protein
MNKELCVTGNMMLRRIIENIKKEVKKAGEMHYEQLRGL